MEVIQYVHRLNMTEAGLSGTKALFLRVQKDARSAVEKFWWKVYISFDTNYPITFSDQTSSKKYELVLRKFSSGAKELRINSIVDYLRDKNIETGDEMIFTRISKTPGIYEYYLSFKKNMCTQLCYVNAKKLHVILHKEYSLLNQSRGNIIVTRYGKEVNLSYEFVEKNTLRDAAAEIIGGSTAKVMLFDLYKVLIGGKSPKGILSLRLSDGGKYTIIEDKRWEIKEINN